MARLNYTDAVGQAREVRLLAQTRLGRDSRSDIHLADRGTSKEHAVIELHERVYWLRDAGSKNGTYVNRRRIVEPHALSEGDELIIGLTRMVFHEDPNDAVMDCVKLETGVAASIHQRVGTSAGQRFLPANEIKDRGQLERDYEKLRIANELNQALARELDPNRLLNVILEQAVKMFGADRGVILLASEDRRTLQPAAVHQASPELADQSFRVSSTILETVIGERSAILSTDAGSDRRFGHARSVVIGKIKATMAVPLLYGEDLLGVIYLDSQLAIGAFADKDLSLLNGFAHQAAKAIELARLIERQKRELLARGQLARLLPAALVDQVMNGEVEVVRGGDQREATVLFSDIRGFTPLAERRPPQEIVRMLNDYFDVMVDIVFRHGGTLDKFIGDAVMAVWGAPIAISDDGYRAVAAALEMQTALRELNAVRAAVGQPELAIGIGVSSGELVAGYMGSSRSMDYTVIGDVVNTAARLCSVAGPGEVLVTQRVYDAVGARVVAESLAQRRLKGKSEAVSVFRITSLVDAP